MTEAVPGLSYSIFRLRSTNDKGLGFDVKDLEDGMSNQEHFTVPIAMPQATNNNPAATAKMDTDADVRNGVEEQTPLTDAEKGAFASAAAGVSDHANHDGKALLPGMTVSGNA